MKMERIQPKKKKTSVPQQPRRTSLELMIIIIVVCILVVAGVAITLYLYKDHADVPTEVAIISAIVIGLPSLLFGYLQWRYPQSPEELIALSSHVSPRSADEPVVVSTITETLPIPTKDAAPAEVGTVRDELSEKAETGRTDAFFLFNVSKLPRADEFYGRVGERKTLLDRAYAQASTSIVGQRRIGKTWLVQYLLLVAKRELGSRFRVAYLSATRPRCRTVSGFTSEALRELGYAEPITEDASNLLLLEKYVQDLQRKNRPPVLCIDEFEGFDRKQGFDLNFFIHMRAIAEAGLCLVVVSKKPLIEIVGEPGKTSGFFNIFEQLSLGPFTRKEAELFVCEKSAQAGFTQREQHTLLHYGQIDAKGWPPLRLQLAGKMLLEDKTLADKSDPSYYRPDDPGYWKHFEERLEEKYFGAVKS
jgi:AAA domain